MVLFPNYSFKISLDESNSALAIKFAFAAANEDSDCVESVAVISPCNLTLSDSTCLSNKLTFEILNFSFLDL